MDSFTGFLKYLYTVLEKSKRFFLSLFVVNIVCCIHAGDFNFFNLISALQGFGSSY